MKKIFLIILFCFFLTGLAMSQGVLAAEEPEEHPLEIEYPDLPGIKAPGPDKRSSP